MTGHVYAVDGATGHERWAAVVVPDTNVHIYDPVIANGVVYVGYVNTVTLVGGTAAVDAATGQVRWALPLPQPDPQAQTGEPVSYGGVTVAGSMVINPSADGTLYGLDTATGVVRYSVPRAMLTQSPQTARAYDLVVAATGGTVIVAFPSGTITALDATDLHRLWAVTPTFTTGIRVVVTSSIGQPGSMVVDNQFVYLTYPFNGFAELRLTDGSTVWLLLAAELPMSEPIVYENFNGAAAIDGDRIYLAGFYDTYAFRRQ